MALSNKPEWRFNFVFLTLAVPQPSHIMGIIEERYKIARYYNPVNESQEEWEMYDLEGDPHEKVNLASLHVSRTSDQVRLTLE